MPGPLPTAGLPLDASGHTWQVFSGVWAGGQACQAASGGLRAGLENRAGSNISHVASQLSPKEPPSQPPMSTLWILRPSFVLACMAPQAGTGTLSGRRPGPSLVTLKAHLLWVALPGAWQERPYTRSSQVPELPIPSHRESKALGQSGAQL